MNLPSIKKAGAEGQNQCLDQSAVVVRFTNPNQISEFTVMLLATSNTIVHCII